MGAYLTRRFLLMVLTLGGTLLALRSLRQETFAT